MSRRMRRVPTYYQDLFDIIGKNPGHVIGSTACLGGALPTQILRAQTNLDLVPKINTWITQMNELFGEGNFFFEMQPSNNREQIYVNKVLLDYSKQFNIPYIITTDSHYLKKEDRLIHKAYLNSQNGDREVDEFYATTYMMNTEELEKYFPYFSKEELSKAYENICFIKESCKDYSILKPLKIPQLLWKKFQNIKTPEMYYDKIPYLKTFMDSDYIGDRELCKAIIEGIERHPDLQNKQAYDEINSNLEMTWISSNVNKAHWSAYYLNLQKIIEECWNSGTLVGPGRGSGVGFILLYVLDITQINPLREKTRMFPWRFLNPERVSVLDVDFDTEGTKRAQMLQHLRSVYGNDRVANVANIASLIPSDRGQLRTLSQCMYGDEENDWAPISQFVFEMEANYPELWNVAKNIEGLINGSGIHAGGIVFVDEPFTNSTSLMRAPDGTICTAFELHDAEAVSLIKYDALSVEAMDKIHNCIELLCEYGYIEQKSSLRETYESVVGIYNIERESQEMWRMIWEHKITSLFQMEKQSGYSGIEILRPSSVDELAILNSTIRLMAQEKGGEMPTEKLARFKNDSNAWLEEMQRYGLGKKEQEILEPILGMSYGLCIAQEQFMELVQLPELGGFSLSWADRLRKSIAKKNPKEYDELTKEFFKTIQEKNINRSFAKYVWNVLIAMSKGYGFNQSHTLAYSLIGLQEMNLAYKYPIVFWNCACLINDAGGNELDDEEEELEDTENCIEENYFNEMEEFSFEEDDEEDIEDSYEEEDCDGYPVEVVTLNDGKKKKKKRSTNYGKIATAIGKMASLGVKIVPPDINNSTFTFSPDVENNAIRYGLSGISMIGKDIIQETINKRPYTSLEDYLSKVKLSKPKVISLIKSGAFDSFGEREEIMHQYIDSIADQKKTINLRNLQMLINFGLIPDKFDLQRRFFNFNKYLKKFKVDDILLLDNIAYRFYEHCEALKEEVNAILWKEMWDKYSLGTISKWEMDSISCYFHKHELKDVLEEDYGCVDYFLLPEEPEVDRVFYKNDKPIPLYKITRIMGTVLDKDKNKNTVTLLTKNGVVNVKIYGNAFANYDKQLSVKNPVTGKKTVIEKSWFKRGNKIIVTGIRRGSNEFVAKKYKNTPYHLVELITNINDGILETKKEREEIECQ